MWEDDGGERCVTTKSQDYANPREMVDGTLWGKVKEEEPSGEAGRSRRGGGS
jgi:hypothetical protein